MTRKEFIDSLKTHYSFMGALSKKNDCEVLRLKNNEQAKEIVLRSYSEPVPAYDFLKDIRHPNLPEVYDTYDLDDGQIVIEEYISGVTVAQMLENGKYAYREAAKIIREVCNALSTLHAADIIHRDIKPENVIISDGGQVKLIDLNAARKYVTDKNSDTVILGTVGYAPPEQFGISQSDAKADIYALGVLLNVMLTGTHPSETLVKGRAGKIVLKCTSIDPNSRFSSVERLRDAL